MSSLVELARRIFYLIPQPVKLLIVKAINDTLLSRCARR